MKNSNVHKMMAVALFAAAGMVLQMFGFPIFPAFGFLKVDFSDIPVMLSMFLFGPGAGIATAAIRSVLHLLVTGFSPDNLIGDTASFLATTIFTLPMYYFFKGHAESKVKKGIGVVTGIVSMAAFMSIANYLVITPLYLKIFGLTADAMLKMSLAKYVAIGVLPFNLIKGVLVSAVFLVLYTKLVPWLAKKGRQYNSHGAK